MTHRSCRWLIQSLLLAALIAASVQAAAATAGSAVTQSRAQAQDTASNTAQNTAQSQSERGGPADGDAAVGRPGRVRRYYLGPQPDQKRQTGPNTGPPLVILPQPFVPSGVILEAVQPPPPSAVAINAGSGDGASGDAASGVGSEVGLPAGSDFTEGVDGDPGLAVATSLTQTQASRSGSLAPSVVATAPLIEPPLAGVAALSGRQAIEAQLWRGIPVADAAGLLRQLSEGGYLPAARTLAQRVLLSGISPELEPGDDAAALLDARIDALIGMGDRRALAQLVAALPSGAPWPTDAARRSRAYLFVGRSQDACRTAAAVSAAARRQDGIFWAQLSAFCSALEGQRERVDFQLTILEELTRPSDAFYELVDQILIAAERRARGEGPVNPPSLTAALPLQPLEVAMAAAADVTVDQVDIPEGADGSRAPLQPSALMAADRLFASPRLSAAARADIATVLVLRGGAAALPLAGYLRAAAPADLAGFPALVALRGIATAAVPPPSSPPEESQGATPDTPLGGTDARPDGSVASTPDRVTPTSGDGMAADRLAALVRYWQALAPQRRAQQAPLLGALTADIVASPAYGGEAAAIALRTALAAGDYQRAAGWWRLMRGTPAGRDVATDAALVASLPLMLASGGMEAQPGLLRRWWRAASDTPGAGDQADMVFSLLQALGTPIDESLWYAASATATVRTAALPPAAVWRRVLAAAARGERATTLAGALSLTAVASGTAEAGTAPHASVASAGIGLLNGAEFEADARMLAVDILLAAGL